MPTGHRDKGKLCEIEGSKFWDEMSCTSVMEECLKPKDGGSMVL
jgi:hypothetical protein